MTDNIQTEYLTTKQAAEYLNSTEGTLRWWRHCGVGPRSFKIRKSVRYRRADLIAWVDSQIETTGVGETP